jgi:prevent-host-death family protein
MRYSAQIRPISYPKANAAEIWQELADQRLPMVITQNGDAKAVIQDVASYEQTQETLALLKILALGNQQVAQGRVKPLANVVKRLRARSVAEGLWHFRSFSLKMLNATWKNCSLTSRRTTRSEVPRVS